MPFGVEKLEWLGHPMVKKFESMINRFDRMYERDRQTDRRRMTAKAALDASIARQKLIKVDNNFIFLQNFKI